MSNRMAQRAEMDAAVRSGRVQLGTDGVSVTLDGKRIPAGFVSNGLRAAVLRLLAGSAR